MRVAFLGNAPLSVPSLEAVAASAHQVVLVVTRDPRPAGRRGRPRPTAVAQACRRLGLPLLEAPTIKGEPGLGLLRDAVPDALTVVAYGEILPQEILALPRAAPVNVHFSLLPALRGADPVRRAIIEGHPTTGVTTMRMDAGMDTGPVLLQATTRIGEGEDAGALGERLAVLGGELLVRTLDGLEAGVIRELPQDDSRATAAPKLRPEEEWIDWTGDAERVVRLVRALAPDPGARTRFRGRVLKVLRARLAHGAGEPGSIVEASKDLLVAAAGGGAVSLEEVIPEGRRRMSGPEFARGARPEIGERFGA
jgi:methionyl-tRNA formyltransferase